jgi:ABC-type uncharacterized transport system permease subunit
MGVAPDESTGSRKYTVTMSLSFGLFGADHALVSAPLLLQSLLAFVAYVAVAVLPSASPARLRAPLLVGWIAHGVDIVMDAAGVGMGSTGARFGFAPALSVTLWLVIGVYMLESRFLPMSGVRRTLAVLGAAAVLLATLFPGESRPHLASAWIPLHWVLGIASYGLFGAAVLHAAMLNRADQQMRGMRSGPTRAGNAGASHAGMPLMRLERLTFQFVLAGFVVLSVALLLGAWFASPWRWDHKTVFSLLGWCVFAALLAGRSAFGWRGPQATRWLYAGAGLLLLAYVGSRFVMEVVLHRAVLP